MVSLIFLMIAGDVPAGATRPKNVLASQFGTPASAIVGMSGNSGVRIYLRSERAELALASQALKDCDVLEGRIDCLAQNGGRRLAAAAIRNRSELGATAPLEQLASQMRQAARSSVTIVDLAGVGLGVIDELLKVFQGESGCTTSIWNPQ